MDPTQFFTASRLAIVAGKGGVGKTTVTASLGWAAADAGLDVLLIEVEPDGSLARCFSLAPSDYAGQALRTTPPGRLWGRSVTPDHALRDYLGDHGLRRLGNRLFSSGTLDVVATAAPGIEDILVLGKVKSLERTGEQQLIILDAPAAGHAITFLQSAKGLVDAVGTGPVHQQAVDVLEMLTDPTRCQVILVTLPEETPVNEAVETAFALEEKVGVSLGPIIVNGCLTVPGPALSSDDLLDLAAGQGVTLPPHTAEAAVAAAAFQRQRAELQVDQLARLADRLPLAQLHLPFLSGGASGPDAIARLAAVCTAELSRLTS